MVHKKTNRGNFMKTFDDSIDIPDVFATTTHVEDAGGGCIRIYNCVVKGDRLVPVGNSVVFPIDCILRTGPRTRTFAHQLATMIEAKAKSAAH